MKHLLKYVSDENGNTISSWVVYSFFLVSNGSSEQLLFFALELELRWKIETANTVDYFHMAFTCQSWLFTYIFIYDWSYERACSFLLNIFIEIMNQETDGVIWDLWVSISELKLKQFSGQTKNKYCWSLS